MGEANAQSQSEPFIVNSPQPTFQKHKYPVTANSPPPPHSPMCDHHHILQQNQEAVEPTDLFSMMHLTNGNGCSNLQPPCSAATNNNPMKRRSTPSSPLFPLLPYTFLEWTHPKRLISLPLLHVEKFIVHTSSSSLTFPSRLALPHYSSSHTCIFSASSNSLILFCMGFLFIFIW